MSGAVAGERFIEVGGNRLHVAVDGGTDRPWLTCLHALASNLDYGSRRSPRSALPSGC